MSLGDYLPLPFAQALFPPTNTGKGEMPAQYAVFTLSEPPNVLMGLGEKTDCGGI